MAERGRLAAGVFEGTVIVASILLAFAIDAAWEARQQSRVRAELIGLLIDDFEVTADGLDEAIALAEKKAEENTRFLRIISTGSPISRDEFSALAYNFVLFDGFEPALANYHAAVGSDGLASIHSPAFSEAVADFIKWNDVFDMHEQVGLEMYYLGSTHAIRQELGSLGVLLRTEDDCSGRSCIYPPELDMSMVELREFMLRPRVFSAFESSRIVQINMLQSLRDMQGAARDVLSALHALR